MACACSFVAAPSERLARSPALAGENRLVVCVQYSTKVFKDDKWAIHYYAPIQGHELVTRRDLIPSGWTIPAPVSGTTSYNSVATYNAQNEFMLTARLVCCQPILISEPGDGAERKRACINGPRSTRQGFQMVKKW